MSGIAFTDNGDGTIVASGTTAYSKFILSKGTAFPEGAFIISGCPLDGHNGNYYDIHLTLYSNNSAVKVFYDRGNGTDTFDCSQYSYDRYELAIHIYNISSKEVTLDNVVFSPKLSVSPEKAAISVEYMEPAYIGPISYTPNAKGEVIFNSQYDSDSEPSTNICISVDYSSAKIAVEYNRDINKILNLTFNDLITIESADRTFD